MTFTKVGCGAKVMHNNELENLDVGPHPCRVHVVDFTITVGSMLISLILIKLEVRFNLAVFSLIR